MGTEKPDKLDEQILRAAKEIVVKFIETGRLSPTTFPETFRSIYRGIEDVVKEPAQDVPENSDEKSTP